MNNNPLLQNYLKFSARRVNTALDHLLPIEKQIPEKLHQAMRYMVLDGGKRIRPCLVYATGQVFDIKPEHLNHLACAVELIHAYSLVHDDLPAMDNDDLRRGKASCHKQFDEATAILVGDALQALAFFTLTHQGADIAPEKTLEMVETLALASGSRGMVGGQAIDLDSINKVLTLPELENMHIHKTGALIRSSVKLGALVSDSASADELKKLDHFAKCIGLAFQVRDDILDVSGTAEKMGKTIGKDQAADKSTYPALLGLSGAQEMCQQLIDDALQSLDCFNEKADPLRWLATYIAQRNC